MALLFEQPASVRRPAGVVRVVGEDRLSFLHTLLSQHLEQSSPGDAADFLYLDAKGYPIATGRALVRQDDVLLVTPDDVAAVLAEKLDAMRFLLRVEVSDVSGDWSLVSVRGGGPPPGPARPMTFTEEDGGLVVRDRSGGLDLLGPPAFVEARLVALGLPEAAAGDWDAWRIAAGEPAWGREIAPGHRPQELGLLPTHVHLRKGCYPGQESVAKTWNLGRPRRALAVIELDTAPEAGSVRVADKDARVTSAAEHDGRWLAMALVPVDAEGRLPDTVEHPPGRVVRKVGDGLPIPGGEST